MSETLDLFLEALAGWCMALAAAVACIALATFVVVCSAALVVFQIVRVACRPFVRGGAKGVTREAVE